MIFREGGGGGRHPDFTKLEGAPIFGQTEGGDTQIWYNGWEGAYSDLAVAKSNIFHAHQ